VALVFEILTLPVIASVDEFAVWPMAMLVALVLPAAGWRAVYNGVTG